MALRNIPDRVNVRKPLTGVWESKYLLRDDLIEVLHEKLVEERLGPDDDVMVNALRSAGPLYVHAIPTLL